MSNYRRVYIPGGTFFFTVVTHERRPILTLSGMPDLLIGLVENTRATIPFENVAHVILPDHLHCIWQFPDHSSAYSRAWAMIKLKFTKATATNSEAQSLLGSQTRSRLARGDSAVWQKRFWEHAIRDQDDLNAHIHYIHFNPVKHGLVASPFEWRYSSIHRYLQAGFYEPDWKGLQEWPDGIGAE